MSRMTRCTSRFGQRSLDATIGSSVATIAMTATTPPAVIALFLARIVIFLSARFVRSKFMRPAFRRRVVHRSVLKGSDYPTKTPVRYMTAKPPSNPSMTGACTSRSASGRSRAICRRIRTTTWAIAPTPSPRKNTVKGREYTSPPIQAPGDRRHAADQSELHQRPDRRAFLRHRRDDRQPLGRVVQREADDQQRAKGGFAECEGGADRQPFAEIVQTDARRRSAATGPSRRPGPPPRRCARRRASQLPSISSAR